MDDLPPELIAAIEADVSRYREMRLAAARKKMEKEKTRKRPHPLQEKRDELKRPEVVFEIARRVVAGASIGRISKKEYGFQSNSTVRSVLWQWALDRISERPRGWSLDDYLKVAVDGEAPSNR